MVGNGTQPTAIMGEVTDAEYHAVKFGNPDDNEVHEVVQEGRDSVGTHFTIGAS